MQAGAHYGQSTPPMPYAGGALPAPVSFDGSNLTQPQMGIPGTQLPGTQPPGMQLPGGAPYNVAHGQMGSPTNAQYNAMNGQMGPPTNAAAATMSRGTSGQPAAYAQSGRPQTPRTPRSASLFEQFTAAVQELWDGGGSDDAPRTPRTAGRQMIEVVLQCCFAAGIDLSAIPVKHKCFALRAGEGPWSIGRQQQPMLFTRLVPDEAMRTCISRIHFEIAWDAKICPNIPRLLKKTNNELLLNGQPAPNQWVPIPNGTKISACGQDNRTPILTFVVLLRDAAAVAAQGMTPQPTHPDLPAMVAPQQMMSQQGYSPTPHANAALPYSQPPAQQPPQPQQRSFGFCGVSPRSSQQPGGQWGAPVPMQQPPGGASCGLSAPYRLVCVLARGCDNLGSWPLEKKMIGVSGDAKSTLGRSHQTGFFEALLNTEQQYLTCVSRAHVDMFPMPPNSHEPPGSFEVTNLSINPIVIDNEQLQKGQRAVLRPFMSIDFIAQLAHSPQPVCYLRLNLEPSANTADAGWGTLRRNSSEVMPAHMPAANVPSQSAPPQSQLPQTALTPQLPQSALAQPQLRGDWAGAADFPVDDRTLMMPRSPHSGSPNVGKTFSESKAPFYLVLGGSGVREEVEPARRRFPGEFDGLTVGRSQMKQLLTDSLKREVLQYVSRNHFRIEHSSASRSGYQLVCLSSNPVWRTRAARHVELNEGEPPLDLQEADAIMLFTGAEDCTPDGPGNEGGLHFTFFQEFPDDNVICFRQALSAGPQNASFGSRSPRSGHGMPFPVPSNHGYSGGGMPFPAPSSQAVERNLPTEFATQDGHGELKASLDWYTDHWREKYR